MGEGTGFGGGRVVSVSMAARRELGRQFVGEMFLHPSLLFAGDALFSGAGVSRGGGVVSIGFVGFVGLGGVVVPVRFFHGGREGFSSMGRRRFAVLFARFGRNGRSRADVAWRLSEEGSFVSWRGRDCDLVRDLSLDRDVFFSPSAAESVVRDRDLLRASPPPPRWSDLESPARVRLLLPADLTAVESSAIFLDRLRLLDDR